MNNVIMYSIQAAINSMKDLTNSDRLEVIVILPCNWIITILQVNDCYTINW